MDNNPVGGGIMDNQGLTEASKDRLLALMRPADGVLWSASAQGLLNTISEAHDPVAALAYVFETKPWAHWSGPRTPASEFPQPFDTNPSGRNAEDFKALQNDERTMRQLDALAAQIIADEPDELERAKRAWAFLKTVRPYVGCVTMLQVMLDGGMFVSDATPFRDEARYNVILPDAEFNTILW